MSYKLFTLPEVAQKKITEKRQAGVPDITMLNEQQLYIFNDILDTRLTKKGGNISLITGVAGVGKTFTISRILEQYLKDNWTSRVSFTATTNRAVKVAYGSSEFFHTNLEYCTIHKLLGLREVILPDGSLDFVPDYKVSPAIQYCKLVFVDETSMLNKKLFHYLLPYVDSGVKIVFVGDACQIPPVKEKDALPFDPEVQKEYDIKVYSLTQIVRQAADNPIIEVTTKIRKYIASPISVSNLYGRKDKVWQGDKGVFFVDRYDKKDINYYDDLLGHMFCSPNFKADANFAKVVSWRNKVANRINRGVRKMIFGTGKLRRIEIGEKIITKAPVFEGDIVIVPNAEELEVLAFEKREEVINDGQFIIPYYITRVRYTDIVGTEIVRHINIPTDLGQIAWVKVLNLLAAEAKSHRQGTIGSTTAWRAFWDFKKQFADIGYNYAVTSHSCQGGTYDNCVTMEMDIICNPRVIERNRIMYTAAARPVSRLWIV